MADQNEKDSRTFPCCGGMGLFLVHWDPKQIPAVTLECNLCGCLWQPVSKDQPVQFRLVERSRAQQLQN